MLHLCVECNVDADCYGGTCEPTTHRCVTSCDADASACPYGSACNPMTHACYSCNDPADCYSTRGVYYCDNSVGRCVQCLDDSNCLTADRPFCNRTSGRCVECLYNQDCQPEQFCVPGMHVCVDTAAIEGGARSLVDANSDGPFR
jgi:hypothetical protein